MPLTIYLGCNVVEFLKMYWPLQLAVLMVFNWGQYQVSIDLRMVEMQQLFQFWHKNETLMGLSAVEISSQLCISHVEVAVGWLVTAPSNTAAISKERGEAEGHEPLS